MVLATACVSGNGGVGSAQGAASGCGFGNCAGCCQFGVCQAGNGSTTCGLGGNVCSICTVAEVCLPAGFCGIDPESEWLVQPAKAVISTSNNGASWDGDGSPPDVQVTVTCPSATSAGKLGVTPQKESYSPTWTSGGCVTKAKYLLSAPFTFSLDDIDVAADDSITGKFAYQATADDLADASVSFGAKFGMESIEIWFVKQ